MALTPVMSSTDLELPAELLDVKPLSGANRRASSPASLQGVRGVDELHKWVVRALYSAPAPGDGPTKEPGRAELEEVAQARYEKLSSSLEQVAILGWRRRDTRSSLALSSRLPY